MMLANTIWEALLAPRQLALLIGVVIPLTAIIAYYWHRTLKHRSDNELKRDMVERGMSAEEIERVMRAGKRGD